jgi:hypothetical protein
VHVRKGLDTSKRLLVEILTAKVLQVRTPSSGGKAIVTKCQETWLNCILVFFGRANMDDELGCLSKEIPSELLKIFQQLLLLPDCSKM